MVSQFLIFIQVLSSLSPSVATQWSNEVTKSVNVNTRIISKVEFACLFNLAEKPDFRDYYKPKTDHQRLQLGEVCILHKARFKSRVRPSLLVCLFLLNFFT